jgi:hypothetical protein
MGNFINCFANRGSLNKEGKGASTWDVFVTQNNDIIFNQRLIDVDYAALIGTIKDARKGDIF